MDWGWHLSVWKPSQRSPHETFQEKNHSPCSGPITNNPLGTKETYPHNGETGKTSTQQCRLLRGYGTVPRRVNTYHLPKDFGQFFIFFAWLSGEPFFLSHFLLSLQSMITNHDYQLSLSKILTMITKKPVKFNSNETFVCRHSAKTFWISSFRRWKLQDGPVQVSKWSSGTPMNGLQKMGNWLFFTPISGIINIYLYTVCQWLLGESSRLVSAS